VSVHRDQRKTPFKLGIDEIKIQACSHFFCYTFQKENASYADDDLQVLVVLALPNPQLDRGRPTRSPTGYNTTTPRSDRLLSDSMACLLLVLVGETTALRASSQVGEFDPYLIWEIRPLLWFLLSPEPSEKNPVRKRLLIVKGSWCWQA
jgi:hypothetical protein